MSKGKNKGPRVTGNPDESFSALGTTFERYGRYSVAHTHRTPEQQSELERSLWEGRPFVLEKLETATRELCEIINRYDSLEVVSNLFLRNCVHNPNKYREFSSELRPHFVEHAAILELKNPKFREYTEMPKPVDGEDLDRAQALLEEIFEGTAWYYVGEGADPDRSGRTRLGELRFLTLLHGMVVRSPAYTQHWQTVLTELFECFAANLWLKGSRGYGFQQALKFAGAVEKIITTRLNMRFEQARDAVRDFEVEFPNYKRNRNRVDGTEKNPFYEQLCEMPTKSANEQFKFAIASWICFALPLVLSFPPKVLAESVQDDEKAAAAFLEDFSLQFGSTPADYVLPSPANALHERPLIAHGGTYLCPAPHLLEWALKPRLEQLLDGSPAWESYNRHRANFLIQKGVSCFLEILPTSKAYTNLFYKLAGGEEAELDALILFDRYAFLIEGKAGAFGAAKRGGKPRLVKQLNQLVGDPAAQAKRAFEYLASTDDPVFRLTSGESVRFDKTIHSEVVEVTLTLESLDIYTADLHKLRDLGVLSGPELPWAVCLSDLMAISEVISRPSEFTHFLQWRRSANRSEQISMMMDELNWLAVYFREGPDQPTVPTGTSWLTYTNYLEGFDNFFLFQAGSRTQAAPRPSQHLPERVDRLIGAFEASSKRGFTEAAEFLYDLDKLDRERLSSTLRSLRARFRKGKADHVTMETKNKAIRIRIKSEEEDWTASSEASRLCVSMHKDILVVQLDGRGDWAVLNWSISRS